MAFYYVKSGGTATGDAGRATSKRTGTFAAMGASAYYDSVHDVFDVVPTTAPVADDLILTSDSHSKTLGSYMDWGVAESVSGGTIGVVSVDDANCDAYSAGAVENCATGLDHRMKGPLSVYGFDFTVQDDFVTVTSDCHWLFYECTFTITGNGDGIYLSQDGSVGTFRKCEFSFDNSSAKMFVLFGGAAVYLDDCYITGSTAPTELFNIGITGGGRAICRGCDFSAAAVPYVHSGNSDMALAGDLVDIQLYDCKLNASTAMVEYSPRKRCQTIKVVGGGTVSADAEFQYTEITRNGQIDSDTTFYRDGSTAFPDSGQQVSLKAVTTSQASMFEPFIVPFSSIYAELSAGASDVLTIYILSSASLTDGDVWAAATYPDGTTKNLGNMVDSVSSALDPLRTASALDTNTESWTGRTTENRYHITLDTSGDPGADCVPEIQLFVAKPSATIYFCPSIGLG